MAPDKREQREDRQSTDASLRAERQKTIEDLAKRRELAEEDADTVVRQARERADAILQAARGKEDRKSDLAGSSLSELKVQREERVREDLQVDQWRTEADLALDVERIERRRVVAALLLIEREETDSRLHAERGYSDVALENRDDLLAVVSHDLGTMLSGIALSAALLVKTAASTDPKGKPVKLADNIQRVTARMSRLVYDLVDLVAVDTGKLTMKFAQHDARSLLLDAVGVFQEKAAAKHVHIAVENSDEHGTALMARFDQERALQVLGNLLGNAIKFSNEGGMVSARVESREGELRFVVEDRGPGIPAKQIEHIFDRFWRASSEDSRSFGLGLYISKRIVEAHGGRLWVESKPGSGSTFYFALPTGKPVDEQADPSVH